LRGVLYFTSEVAAMLILGQHRANRTTFCWYTRLIYGDEEYAFFLAVATSIGEVLD